MKITHHNLIKFVKKDAKTIKHLNSELKNAIILNEIAKFFGWRHFKEFSLHKEGEKNKQVKTLSEIDYQDFIGLKNSYCEYVFELFSISEHKNRAYFYKNNALSKIKITKKYIIKSGYNHTCHFDLSKSHFIVFDNNEFLDFVNDYLKRYFENSIKNISKDNMDMLGSCLDIKKPKKVSEKSFNIGSENISNFIWVQKLTGVLRDLIKLADRNSLNYQNFLFKFFDVDFLKNYLISNNISIEELGEKYKMLYDMPCIDSIKEDNNKYKEVFAEKIMYLTIQIYPLMKFINSKDSMKNKIKLADLKHIDKNVSIEIESGEYNDIFVSYFFNYLK